MVPLTRDQLVEDRANGEAGRRSICPKEEQLTEAQVIESVIGRDVLEAREQIVVLTEEDYDALSKDQKKKWKGYLYKMTYEVWDEAAVDAGETDDKGWEEKKSDVENSMEELLSMVNDHSWLEWSSSHPDGKRDWIISDGEENYRTGEKTYYNLWIERGDKKALSKQEMAYIHEEFRMLGRF